MEWVGFRDNHTNDSLFVYSILYVNVRQVMKTQKGSRGTALIFF